MKTRREFITRAAQGIAAGCAGLSAVASLGVRVPEVAYRRSGTRFIAEAKEGWRYMWSGDVLYGCHPDHMPEKTYKDSDGQWVTEPVQFRLAPEWQDAPTRGQG